MTPPILEFKGPYRFLSNFYLSPVSSWSGFQYPSAEHAYQAAKCWDPDKQEWNESKHRQIREAATPALAKRLGRGVVLPTRWEDTRVRIMFLVVAAKFEVGSSMAQQLLDTGDAHLEEGNHWGDTFWGVSPAGSGIGQNMLGRLLMQWRGALQQAPLP